MAEISKSKKTVYLAIAVIVVVVLAFVAMGSFGSNKAPAPTAVPNQDSAPQNISDSYSVTPDSGTSSPDTGSGSTSDNNFSSDSGRTVSPSDAASMDESDGPGISRDTTTPSDTDNGTINPD